MEMYPFQGWFCFSVILVWLEGGEIRRVTFTNKSHYPISNSY